MYLRFGVNAVAVYKVNVSLPEHLVSEIDEAAGALGLSRSGFIAEASTRYVADVKNLSAAEQRKKDIERAMAGMARLGSKLNKQDIQDLMDQVRRDRDRDTPEEFRR